jgi:hypothetical protein
VRQLVSRNDSCNKRFQTVVTKYLLIFNGTERYVYFSNHKTKGSHITPASGAANLTPEMYLKGTFETPEY